MVTSIEVAAAPGLPRLPDLDWLQRHLVRATEQVRRPVARVAVRVVDDAEMRRLHRAYHHIDQTTDVLTWPLSDADEPIDADMAVCVDEAARRGAELGHSIERELLLYCLHGVLHCAGFDDHDEADSRSMHAEEDRVLQAIGVGPTFAPPRSAEP